MLLIKNQAGDFLLQPNPPTGIWGGLYCPPQVNELKTSMDVDAITVHSKQTHPMLKHSFSHFSLEITPVTCVITETKEIIAESSHIWYKSGSSTSLGLAAPVKKLLELYN